MPAGAAPFDDPLVDRLPESLLLESMAQTAGMLCAATARWTRKMLLAKVESAAFAAAVRPGDRIDLAAEILEDREGTYRVAARAAVGGRGVGEATIFLRGLSIDSEEGRAFDTPAFRAARLENLRRLGVTDYVAPPPA